MGDTKFRWLVFSVIVVGVFEFLSLAGWHLPPLIAAPFFAIVILANLVIKPSDMIAVDAEVVSGSSSVDESTITGEPLPKDKHPGRPVFAGTLNLQGYLEAKVSKLASDWATLLFPECSRLIGFQISSAQKIRVFARPIIPPAITTQTTLAFSL